MNISEGEMDYTKAIIDTIAETKNKTSMRTIKMDWKTAMQFKNLLEERDREDRVLDFGKKFYASTVNDRLIKNASRRIFQK